MVPPPSRTYGLKVIRDPIYTYVSFTPIEDLIIRQPHFQRLRFVIQNSSAYLTYPNASNTRFVHSLGAMNLAGSMFVRSLQNARRGVLRSYLNETSALLVKTADSAQIPDDAAQRAAFDVLGNSARFAHLPAAGKRMRVTRRDIYCVNMLWQAVRLAALIHDIGHLPMSHVFEYAIEDYRSGLAGDAKNPFAEEHQRRMSDFLARHEDVSKELGTDAHEQIANWQLHEFLGASLAAQTYLYYKDVHDPLLLASAGMAYRLAKLVLFLTPEGSAASFPTLRCAHSLVSSELDADRLDYCVRDPLASGLEFGAIDVRRIVASMTLIKTTKGGFQFVSSAKSLSAIETFFHQRFLQYKYMIYHHNVVRMDGIVREILVRFLEAAVRPIDSPLRRLLDAFGLWSQVPNEKTKFQFLAKAGFEHFDDAWLRALMSEARLLARHAARHSVEGLTKDEAKELELLLDTFLYRNTDNLVSLWKRDSDFQHTAREVAAALAAKDGGISPDRRTLLSFLLFDHKSPEPSFVVKLRGDLAPDGVVVIWKINRAKIVEPSKAGPKALRVLIGRRVQLASSVSPYLGSLRSVAKRTPNIHVSFVANKLKGNTDLVGKCRRAAIERIAEYVAERLREDKKEAKQEQEEAQGRSEVSDAYKARGVGIAGRAGSGKRSKDK